MTKVIVADTGPLIALALVDMLPVLPRLFTEVFVPESVLEEATADLSKPGAQAISIALKNGWVISHAVEMTETYRDLIDFLDKGEVDALVLAKQLNAIALIDERKGRNAAKKHGISITGSAAVLIMAKQQGFIASVKSAVDLLREHGYRMSDKLVKEILKRVNE